MPSIPPPLPSLLLFLLLCPLPSPTRAASPFNLSKPDVLPLRPNLRITAVADWFNILTLCLAPFATHVIFGVGKYIMLSPQHPRWTDKLPHFNPTSILWRYFIITDRRLRAKCWDRADMAGCNAMFWDGTKWDGSGEMMVESRGFVTKLPGKSYVTVVSASSVTTVTLTLQGVQAIAIMVSGAMAMGRGPVSGLPGLFSPLAIMGLSRLLPSLWISNDYGYGDGEARGRAHAEDQDGYAAVIEEMELEVPKMSQDMVLKRLYPISNWRGLVFRGLMFSAAMVTYTFSTMAILRGIAWEFPTASDETRSWDSHFTMSQILGLAMYLALTLGTFIIHTRYIMRGSTILPCIQSWWYTLYTWFLILLALAAFVVGCMETRVIPCGPDCGKFTTLPKEFDACP